MTKADQSGNVEKVTTAAAREGTGRTSEKTRVAVADLRPHPRNPRTISGARLEQLQRTLAADPDMLEARPVIALPDGTVVAGNQRLAAAVALGWESIPVVYADPTQKPVALYVRPIENHLGPGECFYEPFGGSGSALIAAEQTGRVCLAMEVAPAYCDVIRQRYADYVGRPDLAP